MLRPHRLRSVAARSFSIAVALAFLAATGGELLAHERCPHHHSTAHGEAGSHATHTSAAQHPSGSPAHGHDAPCTCVGICHSTAATPFPASTHLGWVVAATEQQAFASALRRWELPGSSLYTLPLANPPPSVG